ncbi:MAG: T9SS type A sorting domain-containing protein [Bacteroidetes bacterium]|nr:T9SS type A sorting domain-containing protein [Bacteroidota bacterium]
MKHTSLTALLFLGFAMSYAQYGPQQIISTNANLAFRAIPHDMDNDGFMDVVSASTGDGKVAWYRNLDGQGTFGEEQIITNGALVIQGMEMADLDSDGDMDVIYKTNLDKIAWLENLDGLGTFGSEQIIVQTTYPYSMAVADLDTDGDMDVLAIHYISGFDVRLVWYENLDGMGNFGPEIFVGEEMYDETHLSAFDLDADGDMDIIASYYDGPSKLVWYENDGLGTFAAEQEIFHFGLSSDWPSIIHLTPSDFNGDGKIDLLFDTDYDDGDDYIYWLEHLDGEGMFGEAQLIYIKETSVGSLRAYDLDGDNDQDILVSFYWNANTVAWFENIDGQGNFGPKHNITTSVVRGTDATAADLNGDGDLDVISASSFDFKIAWYEYLEPLDISDNNYSRVVLYPNPTQGLVTLFSDQTITKIELLNSLGQNIDLTWDTSQIDLSKLESGIYFLRLEDETGFSEIHKIIKK